MPTYASKDDLEQFFGSNTITDWADKDRSGSLSSGELSAIDNAINAAEATVDSYLARAGYAAPFDSDAFALLSDRNRGLIRNATCALAGYTLYAARGIRDTHNPIQAIRDTVIADLQALADGAPLAGMPRVERTDFGHSESGRTVDTADDSDDTRRFTSDAMRHW